MLLSSILFVCLSLGGCYICCKSVIVLFILFLLPRSLSCRLKITTTQSLIINYIYVVGLIFLMYIGVTKLIVLTIM